LCSLRPLLGCYTLFRLRRVGVSPVSHEVLAAMRRVSGRLGLRRAVGVVRSTLAQVPVVVGYVRPIILLPVGLLTNIPAAQLEAILAHELAHVQRHDFVVNLLQTLVETLCFYHPAVWWLSHRIRVEREHCCDDLVVARLGNRVEYGRALVAIETLRGSSARLALGIDDGRLLARVHRIVGIDAARRNDRWPVTFVGLVMLGLVVTVTCGSLVVSNAHSDDEISGSQEVVVTEPAANDVATAAEQKPRVDEPDGWGAEGHGLKCRLTPVLASSDDEAPERSEKTDRFVGADGVTLAVELKNVGDRPQSLLGVRYMFQGNPHDGKLLTEFYAPQLFELEFTDAAGRPVPRTARVLIDSDFILSAASAHEVAPGESLTMLLRPAKFEAPEDHRLPPGTYRARIRYHGPRAGTLAYFRDNFPDSPQAKAWSHEVASNEVTFTVAEDPADSKPPHLVWGETKDGLQGALEFRHVRGRTSPADPPGTFPMKPWVDTIFHVKNVSDRPITFVSERGRQGDQFTATNEAGEAKRLEVGFTSGVPIVYRWMLQPGEIAELHAFGPLGAIDQPGKYTIRCAINFASLSMNGEGESGFPKKDDWQQVLVTGDTPVTLRARTEDDDRRDAAPEKKAAGDQGLSLSDAVRDFNAQNKQHERGQDQPSLTEAEVVTAIERSDWKRDAPDVSEREFLAFKAIAKTRRLPKGATLEVLTGLKPDAFTLIELWSIRIDMPALERPGTNGFTIRHTTVREERIDPGSIAWGKPDGDGLSIGLLLWPKRDKYVLGERTRLRLYVRNEGRKQVEVTFPNTTFPEADDFIITDQAGAIIAVHNGDEAWSIPWVSGYMASRLEPGGAHELRVPFELQIGGDAVSTTVGRIIAARPGQTLQLRVRTTNGSERTRDKDEPLPESGVVTFTVTENRDAARADGEARSDDKGKRKAPAGPTFVLPDHLNVMAVGFDHGSQDLVSVSTEKKVVIRTWDIHERKLKGEIALDSEKHGNLFLSGHLTLSDDRTRVIAMIDGRVGIWETATGKVVKMLTLPDEMQHGQMRGLACTPDMSFIACGLTPGRSGFAPSDAYAIVWETASGRVLQTVKHAGAVQVHCVALSPDGKWLASGGQQTGTCVWEVSTGKRLLALPNANPNRKHPDPEVSETGANQVLCLEFSPDGRQLAMGDMLGVKLVEAASGELVHRFDAPFRYGRSGLVFSRDGRLLARTATDNVVPIWSTQTGDLLAELGSEAHDGTFSDDGQWFAVGFTHEKHGVAVWRLREGL
jgi:WD40 repeat protein